MQPDYGRNTDRQNVGTELPKKANADFTDKFSVVFVYRCCCLNFSTCKRIFQVPGPEFRTGMMKNGEKCNKFKKILPLTQLPAYDIFNL